MRFLIVFAAIVIFSVVQVQSAMTKEEMEKMFMASAQECKSKEGATDDDLAFMASKTAPTTQAGKCVIACIGEKDGIVRFVIIKL